jgi:GTP-binding protein
MDIRNIAIIAHVDHGKTTLVDQLLRQSGSFRANQQVAERALDSNELERERGITILAKCTSVVWRDVRINIVDTPGHADFGGEVERILSMVDGVLVLVDAAEGPMPQTKFVLGKALRRGLKPIVVINKVDRPDARPGAVHNEIFDLFALLDASEGQLDFPTLFASGRDGWATPEFDGPRHDLAPLFELIIAHVPPPEADPDAPFAMLATTLEYDPFLGRMLTGRIHSGVARLNMPVKSLSRDGRILEQARLTKLLAFRGLEHRPTEEARAGDIVAVAGLQLTTVADTICAPEVTAALPADPIDPPTLAMTFSVNDSPLAGRDGGKVTSRVIAERLHREAEGNVAFKVQENAARDAARRFRIVDLAPARAVQERSEKRAAAGAGRRSHHRRRRGFRGDRRRQDEPPQGGAAGDAAVRRRQIAAVVSGADPGPDRLSRRIPDRHARQRGDEPAVSRLCAV